MKPDLKFLVSHIFALIVFLLGFYSLVLYQFALPELIQGAFISFMTLAAQYVFGESLSSSVGKRAQASFEAGLNATPTTPTVEVTNTPEQQEVTIEPDQNRLPRG